jgi:DNA sulfur modification protein DndC
MATDPSKIDAYGEKLRSVRRDLREEYLAPHRHPWIIGFSGGKDSTLLTHLVFEMLLAIAPDERKRPVYLISNDTLVESPVFQEHVDRLLNQISDGLEALRVPVQVIKTHPLVEESFWVNILGRGYPAPNRSFRWCTDRMKVRPTSRFIRQIATENGEAILLLGVRSAESAARSANINRHRAADDGRLAPHSDHKGVSVYSPIKDLTTEEVWITLLNARPPWGGTYRDLVALYKNAQSGECPFVVSSDDAPSCGTNSARFGCWTCTVVDKDNSMDALIASGKDHLLPLAEFRNRLIAVSENPEYRSKIRRNGQPGLGPLTFEAREMLLNELLTLREEIGMPLISEHEVRMIQDQWAEDRTTEIVREMPSLALASV